MKQSGNILITRKRIAESAVHTLNEAGFDLIYSLPGSTSAEIAQTARAKAVVAIMVSQGAITQEVIEASPDLKVLVKHGSGVNNIDIKAAAKRGIPVYRAVGANARAVAEHAIAMLITLLKRLPMLDASTKRGEWIKGDFIGRDFHDIRLGLVGYGAIAKNVAGFARALGMSVGCFDPFAEKTGEVAWHERLAELIAWSNAISLHCPLIDQTRHIIDRSVLASMGPDTLLINTARGGLIDETALLDALCQGWIAGAAIDSFETEPPAQDMALFAAPNLMVSPHVAGVTSQAEANMANMAARHIIAHLSGDGIDPRFQVGRELEASSAALQ